MPGSHPCGSWIRQRAKRIQEETKKEYGKEKGERVAYAVATQQAHAKGKSPKRYGTPEGRAEAKDKHEEPEKMQEKAAMWAGYFNESEKLAVSMGAASPLLRILGRSFIRPVKTVRHAFRKKKGLDDVKQMADEGSEKAKKILRHRRLGQAASLAGPAAMVGVPAFTAGRLSKGGGGDSAQTNYYSGH